MIKNKFLLYISLFPFVLFNCFSPIIITSQPEAKIEKPIPPPVIIEIDLTEKFVLQWDNPEGETPASYNIYYKRHEEMIWILLDNINLKEFEISYGDLDGGVYYDFAVSSVYTSPAGESFIHSSLDRSAVPNSGWYIKWVDPVL